MVTPEPKYEEGCIESFARRNPRMTECVETIRNILKNEHHKSGKMPFTAQTALNLDRYERVREKRSTSQSTVDFVVGLRNNYLLPVEAKLEVENVENIVKDIATKRRHSLDILRSSEGFIHHTKQMVILLNDKNFFQKERKLRNLLRNNPIYSIHNVERFHKAYFLE